MKAVEKQARKSYNSLERAAKIADHLSRIASAGRVLDVLRGAIQRILHIQKFHLQLGD